jgi:hypothetical protein
MTRMMSQMALPHENRLEIREVPPKEPELNGDP